MDAPQISQCLVTFTRSLKRIHFFKGIKNLHTRVKRKSYDDIEDGELVEKDEPQVSLTEVI